MQHSDLIADVRPDVPGAPVFVMLDALQRAAHEFFSDSGVWLSQLDPIAMVDGTYEYELQLPNDARIVRIHAPTPEETGVRLGDVPVAVTSQSYIFSRPRDAAGGMPSMLALTAEGDSLVLWPTPNDDVEDEQLYILAVLAPTRDATEIPDALGTRFRDALVSRAKARLMLTAGKTWSNPQQGALEMQMYNEAVANAKRDTMSSRFAAPMSVPMRPFA